jgi:hypothetical protein
MEMTMNLARIALLVTVCLADGIFLLKAAPALAADVIADIAPPPLRNETVGHPRDGYLWAAGHWEWSGQSYRWVGGQWIVAHGRAHWIPDQWEPLGSQWRYVPGHWEH